VQIVEGLIDCEGDLVKLSYATSCTVMLVVCSIHWYCNKKWPWHISMGCWIHL